MLVLSCTISCAAIARGLGHGSLNNNNSSLNHDPLQTTCTIEGRWHPSNDSAHPDVKHVFVPVQNCSNALRRWRFRQLRSSARKAPTRQYPWSFAFLGDSTMGHFFVPFKKHFAERVPAFGSAVAVKYFDFDRENNGDPAQCGLPQYLGITTDADHEKWVQSWNRSGTCKNKPEPGEEDKPSCISGPADQSLKDYPPGCHNCGEHCTPQLHQTPDKLLSLESIPVTWAKDVILQTPTLPTTQAVVADYLTKRTQDEGALIDLCVVNAGTHDMNAVPHGYDSGVYSDNVVEYTVLLTKACRRVLWLGMNSCKCPPHDETYIYKQTNDLILAWNGMAKFKLQELRNPQVFFLDVFDMSFHDFLHDDNVHMGTDYELQLTNMLFDMYGV